MSRASSRSRSASLTALRRLRPWLEGLSIDLRDALAPAAPGDDGELAIGCGPAKHRAVIDGAHLRLLDHDLDAELTMLAFGAPVPACLLHLAAWESARCGADSFLAEWAEDVDDDRWARAVEDWHGNYWESWPSEPAAARALFTPEVQRSLAASLSEAWVASIGPIGPGAAWRDVRRAIALRARRSLVLSLSNVAAHRRPDALVPIDVTVVPEGIASIAGVLSQRRSHVQLRLPVTWLASVWSDGGGALNRGRFVLARNADAGIDTVVSWRPTGGPGREHVGRIEAVVSTG